MTGMLTIEREFTSGAYCLRWVGWPEADGLEPNEDATALIAGDTEADRWVLISAHNRVDAHYVQALADFETDTVDVMERVLLAFGQPWARMDAAMLEAQASEFLGMSEETGLALHTMPLDELEALRAVLSDQPAAMAWSLYMRTMTMNGARCSRGSFGPECS